MWYEKTNNIQVRKDLFFSVLSREMKFSMWTKAQAIYQDKNYLPVYLYLKWQSSKDCSVSSVDISVHSWIMKDHGPVLRQLLSLKILHMSLELFAAFLSAYVGRCAAYTAHLCTEKVFSLQNCLLGSSPFIH